MVLKGNRNNVFWRKITKIVIYAFQQALVDQFPLKCVGEFFIF